MKWLILSLFFSTAFFARSQNVGSLKGKITDENINNEPVAFANVAVYKMDAKNPNADSELVDASSADENGEYYIPNLPTGLYLVEVTYIDFLAPWKLDKVQIETNKTTVLDAKYPKRTEKEEKEYKRNFNCTGIITDISRSIINVTETSNTTTIHADDIRRMGIR